MPPATDNRHLDGLLPVGLALVGLAWLVVPAWLAFGAAITLTPFFGETPSASDEAEAGRLLIIAAMLAVGLPIVGLIAARYLPGRGVRRLFTAMLAIGAVAAVVLVAVAGQVAGADPALAPRRPAGCQEHSGSDNNCPGG